MAERSSSVNPGFFLFVLGFFKSISSRHIFEKVVFPFHTIFESGEFVLRVGCIDIDEVEIGVFDSDDAAFVVVFVDVHSASDADGFGARINGRPRVTFLVGIVPPRPVAVKLEVKLVFTKFGFLKTENIGIEFVEYVGKTFLDDGAQAVDIPGNEFHNDSGWSLEMNTSPDETRDSAPQRAEDGPAPIDRDDTTLFQDCALDERRGMVDGHEHRVAP